MSLGFYVDLKRCIGCKTCQVACKDRHNLLTAGPRPRRVDSFECGTYPDVAMFHLVISCNHCDEPACVKSCPGGALYKAEDGTVQHDKSLCIGCRTCIKVCPYDAPQYLPYQQLIVKCDSCKPLRDNGMNPVCVDACPLRAIEFGDMDELRAKHEDRIANEAGTSISPDDAPASDAPECSSSGTGSSDANAPASDAPKCSDSGTASSDANAPAPDAPECSDSGTGNSEANAPECSDSGTGSSDANAPGIRDGMLTDQLPVTASSDITHPNILWKASAASLREDFHKIEL